MMFKTFHIWYIWYMYEKCKVQDIINQHMNITCQMQSLEIFLALVPLVIIIVFRPDRLSIPLNHMWSS